MKFIKTTVSIVLTLCILAGVFGAVILRPAAESSSALPEIENVSYDPLTPKVSWDAFPGAAKYKVEVYYRSSASTQYQLTEATETVDTFTSWSFYTRGYFKFNILAVNSSGQEISSPAEIEITYMLNVSYIPFNGLLTWNEVTGAALYTIEVLDSSSEKKMFSLETSVQAIDLLGEMNSAGLAAGTYFAKVLPLTSSHSQFISAQTNDFSFAGAPSPTLTEYSVERTEPDGAMVQFKPDQDVRYWYAINSAPAVSGEGTELSNNNASWLYLTGLADGEQTINIIAKNANGKTSNTLSIKIPAYKAPLTSSIYDIYRTGHTTAALQVNSEGAGTLYYAFINGTVMDIIPEITAWKQAELTDGENEVNISDVPTEDAVLWYYVEANNGERTSIDHYPLFKEYVFPEPYILSGSGEVKFTSSVDLEYLSGFTMGENDSAAELTAEGGGRSWSITLPDKDAEYIFYSVVGDNTYISCAVKTEKHEHDFSGEWKSDAEGHYRECICGEKEQSQAHQPDREEATAGRGVVCRVCGYEIAPRLTAFNIIFDSNNGSNVVATLTTNAECKLTSLPEPSAHPDSSYEFLYWSLEKNPDTAKELTLDHVFEANTTVYAVWRKTTLAFWDNIVVGLKDLAPGSSLVVEMNGETKVPANVVDEIAGEDVTVTLDLDNGVQWIVNGTDIPTGETGELDLGVSVGGNYIPEEAISGRFAANQMLQLELSHNGPFGTTLQMSMDLGEKNHGMWANLYYFDTTQNSLVFRSASRINADGNASWPFDHASSYLVVISEGCLEGHTFDDAFDPECNVCGAANDGIVMSVVVVVVTTAVVIAVVVFAVWCFARKRKKN